MKNFLLTLLLGLCFQLKAAPKSEPTKIEYTLEECFKLGLQPVILEDGSMIMPKHDGQNYFIELRDSKPEPARPITADDVHNAVEKLRKAGKVVNDILNVHFVSDLPIVIEKEIGGATVSIVLDALIFTPTGNKLSMSAMVSTPKGDFYAFYSESIKFTGKGGIESGSLKLLVDNNPFLKSDQLGSKIKLEITGGGFSFGCDGFEDFSVFGNVVFDRSLIVPEETDGTVRSGGNVRSAFKLEHIKDFNDIFISITMQPFQMANMKGYGFQVENAIIDLSDRVNPSDFNFPIKYFPNEGGNLWKGVSIGKVSVSFPKNFKKRTSTRRLEVGVNNLLIDKYGVSGEIYGKNIFNIKEGDLSGWDYSLEDVSIILVKSQVQGGSLGGKIRIAISEENKLLAYKAVIDPTRKYYDFTISLVDELEFSFLKAVKVELKPASYVKLALDNEDFIASAMLHGKLDIIAGDKGVKLEEFKFENLFVSTKAPYLSIGSFAGGSGKEYKMGNFPITINSPVISVKDNKANVEFGVNVNLDDMGIYASGGFLIQGQFVNENNRHFWKNTSISLKKLAVEADLSIGYFHGGVEYFNDDPIYGKGYYGNLGLELYLSSSIGIEAAALFGTIDNKRYWFVDGELSTGGSMGGISINLLAGCLYSHMKAVPGSQGPKTLTGVVYAPDFTVGWGGRFGIGFSTGGSAFAGAAGLEVETRTDGSLRKIGFLGQVAVAGSGSMVNAQAVNAKYKMLCNESSLSSPGGITGKLDNDANSIDSKAMSEKFSIGSGASGFTASVIVKFNYDNKNFYGKVGANVTIANTITIQGVGAFLFAPDKWFIHIGEPPISDRIIVKLPALPQFDGYIMLGHGIPELPNPEPDIFTKYPSERSKRGGLDTGVAVSANGIAFGAALTLSSGGDYKVISWDVGVRAGLDMMLMKYPNGAYCAGRAGQGIGINNWRAAAQVYVIGWFHANAFGINVLSAELGAMLKGAAPNPTYGTGQVAVNFKLLFVKFNFNVGFQVGEDCELVGGSESISEGSLVTNTFPTKGSEIPINDSLIPSVSCIEKVESEIYLPPMQGKFKIKVVDYTLKDENGNVIWGDWSVDKNDPTKVIFRPRSPLPTWTLITATTNFQVQKDNNGVWQNFTADGKSFAVSNTTSFTMTITAEKMKEKIGDNTKEAETLGEGIKEKAKVQAQAITTSVATTVKEIKSAVSKIDSTIKEKCKNCSPAGKDSTSKILAKVDSTIEKKTAVVVDSSNKIVERALAKANAVSDSATATIARNNKKAKDDIDANTEQAKAAIDEAIRPIYEKYNEMYKELWSWSRGSYQNHPEWGTMKRVEESMKLYGPKNEEIKKAIAGVNVKYLKASNTIMNEALANNEQIMSKAQFECDVIMANAANASTELLEKLKADCAILMQKAANDCSKIQGYDNSTDMTAYISAIMLNVKNEPISLPAYTPPVDPNNPPVTPQYPVSKLTWDKPDDGGCVNDGNGNVSFTVNVNGLLKDTYAEFSTDGSIWNKGISDVSYTLTVPYVSGTYAMIKSRPSDNKLNGATTVKSLKHCPVATTTTTPAPAVAGNTTGGTPDPVVPPDSVIPPRPRRPTTLKNPLGEEPVEALTDDESKAKTLQDKTDADNALLKELADQEKQRKDYLDAENIRLAQQGETEEQAQLRQADYDAETKKLARNKALEQAYEQKQQALEAENKRIAQQEAIENQKALEQKAIDDEAQRVAKQKVIDDEIAFEEKQADLASRKLFQQEQQAAKERAAQLKLDEESKSVAEQEVREAENTRIEAERKTAELALAQEKADALKKIQADEEAAEQQRQEDIERQNNAAAVRQEAFAEQQEQRSLEELENPNTDVYGSRGFKKKATQWEE